MKAWRVIKVRYLWSQMVSVPEEDKGGRNKIPTLRHLQEENLSQDGLFPLRLQFKYLETFMILCPFWPETTILASYSTRLSILKKLSSYPSPLTKGSWRSDQDCLYLNNYNILLTGLPPSSATVYVTVKSTFLLEHSGDFFKMVGWHLCLWDGVQIPALVIQGHISNFVDSILFYPW
jgi:hypothetical protein